LRFTDVLAKDASKLWEMQYKHPFIQGIGDGTLDLEKFKYYAKQDYLYLKTFDKMWALAIAKCDDVKMNHELVRLLNYTLKFEIELTKFYASKLGVSEKELESQEMTPRTRAYSDFHFSTALNGDLSDVLAAVTPCIWGYYIIFSKLKAKGLPKGNPIYAKSIKAYSSPLSKNLARQLRNMLDKTASKGTDADREKLRRIFLTACRYEYYFWDQAYRQEGWPEE